jgi:hypothetical protein
MFGENPNFMYIYSSVLKQKIAFSNKTMTTWCQDGVKYSEEEIVIISEICDILPIKIHVVKKVFKNSEVVRYQGNHNAW